MLRFHPTSCSNDGKQYICSLQLAYMHSKREQQGPGFGPLNFRCCLFTLIRSSPVHPVSCDPFSAARISLRLLHPWRAMAQRYARSGPGSKDVRYAVLTSRFDQQLCYPAPVLTRTGAAQHAACSVHCTMWHGACTRWHVCAACSMRHAMCSMQHAAWGVQHAVCSMQHGACIVQHGACSMRRAKCSTRHAAWRVQYAACRVATSQQSAQGLGLRATAAANVPMQNPKPFSTPQTARRGLQTQMTLHNAHARASST